jgi:signal transduction histidine kinase
VAGPALIAIPLFTGPEPPDTAVVVVTGFAVLIGAAFEGRPALVAGVLASGWLLGLYAAGGDWSDLGLAFFTVPAYFAGTVLRLRRRTAQALTERLRELEAERALFAQVTVRNERSRIASELHDIVGHALSVMVVQAAAGQRLAARDPDGARASLDAIAQAARQGRADLQRLVDLLSTTDLGASADEPGGDLDLVDEVVALTARSGLDITCRFEGDRDALTSGRSHLVYRVVQESLTNALRYAPGSVVRVLIREEDGRRLTVRVENDAAPSHVRPDFSGGGQGLKGLRERVLAADGSFAAGPSGNGGWRVEARL